MSRLLQLLRPANQLQRVFVLFLLLLLLGGVLALLAGSLVWLLPALAILAGAAFSVEWRLLYYIFLCTLPFSYEISGLAGGLSLDLPSEPLMLLLLGNVGLTLLLHPGALPRREWRHPLLLLLALGYGWAILTMLSSVDVVKSVKFLLAKLWYVGPFLFGTLLLLTRPDRVWRIGALYLGGVCFTVVYTLLRHATRGFSFDAINWAIQPFYLNHVIYATVLALLLPYALYGMRAAGRSHTRWLWGAATLLLFIGLLGSFTRASLLSVPVAALYYFVIRYRLMRLMLVGVMVGTIGLTYYLVHDNTYLQYAPNFERTVFNGQDFEKHLEATYKLEDMSGMERVYRWVAAGHMVADRPWMGSGPSTFYPEYKRYTVWSFHTYVSRNPERSTTHNYFLLLMAEQGVPGFLLFTLLVGATLLLCERLYHRSQLPAQRYIVLASSLSFVIIVFHLLLNELVETDKVGSFFFINIAILIRMQTWLEKSIDVEQAA